MPKFRIKPDYAAFTLLLVFTNICSVSYARLSDTTFQVTNNSFPGQRDAKILNYRVTLPSISPKNAIRATKFYFSTKGTTNASDITAAHLYYTGGTDYTSLVMAGADTMGKVVLTPGSRFVIYSSKLLRPGSNYFLLTFDVSAGAAIGNYLDATLDSVVIGDTLRIVKSGNPAGKRLIDPYGSYCPIKVAKPNSISPQYIGIRNVKIGKNINNASPDLDRLTSYLTLKLTAYRQESYPVEIKYGQGNKEQIIGWADWNNDGIFDANTEQVFYTPSAIPGETYKTTLTVPCSASPGLHVLRIMDDIDTMPKLTPCATLLYGEAEEYMIDVQPDISPAKASFSFDNHTIRSSAVNFANTTVVHGNYNCQWCFTSNCIKGGAFDATGNNVNYSWANPGAYKVKMVLTWAGCDSTVSRSDTTTVFVDKSGATPTPSFIASDNVADTSTIIQLTDLSGNHPAGWLWTITPAVLNGKPAYNFLNGTDVYSQNPVIKFTHTGSYDVTLFASNFSGQASLTRKAYLNIGGFAAMCSGVDTLTTSSGILYDDGGKDHPYGPKKSCYIVIKPPCATAVNINFRSFDVSTLGPGKDNLKIYDSTNNLGKSLHAGAGYNDGFRNIQPGNNPVIPPNIVAKSGSAYIEWNTDSAFTGDGFVAYWTSVLKTQTPPKAAFTGPDSVYLHHVVSLQNNSTGPDLKYFWDLNGDGIIDNTQTNPVFRMDSAGTVNIRLIVQNCGGSDTVYKKIRVVRTSAKPVAAYNTLYTRIGMGDKLQLFDHSKNNPYKWKWKVTPSSGSFDFQFINSADTSQNPVVQFNTAGNYAISLTAINDRGQDIVTKDSALGVDDYCIPNVLGHAPSIGISRVIVTNRQKDTIIDQRSTCGITGYSAFHSLIPSPLVEDDQYTVTVFRDTNLVDVRGIVMLDYTQSDSFQGSIDTLISIRNITGKSWTGTFPMKRIRLGIGRMRVAVLYKNEPVKVCGDVTIGEFEDYNVILQKDTIPPVITLKGKDTIVLQEFSPFTDPGAIVYDATDGDVTYYLVATGIVNTSVPGIYRIAYNAIDKEKNKAKEVYRVVKVIGDTTRPIITLNGSETEYVAVFQSYNEEGATVQDNIDSNLTITTSGTVDTAHTGTYLITYTATDLSGNKATKIRKVFVIDTIAPVVKLIGPNIIKLQFLASYKDSGITATDNYNHQLIITTQRLIDSTKRGKQFIIYAVKDSSGNTTIVKRTIKVDDYIPPVLKFAFDTLNWDVNRSFVDPPAIVTDNYYKLTQVNVRRMDVTYVNVTKLGFYPLYYFAVDSSGNISNTDTIIVHVVDRTPPKIYLLGDSIVYLKTFEKYWIIDGIFRSDNYDLFPTVTETGDFVRADYPYVYFREKGLHVVNYKCTDHSGNVSNSVVRFFYVYDKVSVDPAGTNGPSFQYYPNPANNKLKIEFNTLKPENIDLYITDIAGRQLKTIFSGNTNQLNTSLDISDISPGIYFIRLNSNSETVSYKLVIER